MAWESCRHPTLANRIDPEDLSNADFVFFPQVFVFDENFETPRSWNSAISWEQEFIPNYAFLFKANYVETENITRFINRNDPVFRLALVDRSGARWR